MKEKLISYIDYLFENAPAGALDLKDEITANCLERYDDMLSQGRSEDVAFNAAVASIGDINALFAEFKESPTNTKQGNTASWRALLLSGAVALYIMSFIPPILIPNDIGPCLMFVIWGVATAMIIFRATAFKQYEPKNDSQTERIKQRIDSKTPVRRALSGALWALGVLVYFLLSFATFAWHITWLVFIICIAIDQIIGLVLSLGGKQ